MAINRVSNILYILYTNDSQKCDWLENTVGLMNNPNSAYSKPNLYNNFKTSRTYSNILSFWTSYTSESAAVFVVVTLRPILASDSYLAR